MKKRLNLSLFLIIGCTLLLLITACPDPAGSEKRSEIAPELFGYWEYSDSSLLTVNFNLHSNSITWGGSQGNYLNFPGVKGLTWIAKDGLISYKYSGTSGDAFTYSVYNDQLTLTFVQGGSSYTLTRKSGGLDMDLYYHIKYSSDGNSASNPIQLTLTGNLGSSANSYSEWKTLLDTIGYAGKFVSLDISGCTITGTDFPTYSSSEQWSKKIRIVSITTGSNITNIGSSTLQYFTNLRNVTLPHVTNIGYYAFSFCTNLNTITFPATATVLSNAFSGCANLTTFNLTGSGTLTTTQGGRALVKNGTELIAYPSASGSITMNDILTIGSAFSNNSKITSVNFPNATVISDWTFESCFKLTNVNLPLTEIISLRAFDGCSALTTVNIPGATEIKDAFNICYNITKITLGDSCNINSNNFNEHNGLYRLDEIYYVDAGTYTRSSYRSSWRKL